MRLHVTTASASTRVQLQCITCDRHKHFLLDATQLETRFGCAYSFRLCRGDEGTGESTTSFLARWKEQHVDISASLVGLTTARRA